jgi:hypothetical protein
MFYKAKVALKGFKRLMALHRAISCYPQLNATKFDQKQQLSKTAEAGTIKSDLTAS